MHILGCVVVVVGVGGMRDLLAPCIFFPITSDIRLETADMKGNARDPTWRRSATCEEDKDNVDVSVKSHTITPFKEPLEQKLPCIWKDQ